MSETTSGAYCQQCGATFICDAVFFFQKWSISKYHIHYSFKLLFKWNIHYRTGTKWPWWRWKSWPLPRSDILAEKRKSHVEGPSFTVTLCPPSVQKCGNFGKPDPCSDCKAWGVDLHFWSVHVHSMYNIFYIQYIIHCIVFRLWQPFYRRAPWSICIKADLIRPINNMFQQLKAA